LRAAVVAPGAQLAHPVKTDLDDADSGDLALAKDRFGRAMARPRFAWLGRDDDRRVLDRPRPQESARHVSHCRRLLIPAGMKISSAPRKASARTTSGT